MTTITTEDGDSIEVIPFDHGWQILVTDFDGKGSVLLDHDQTAELVAALLDIPEEALDGAG